MPVLTEHAPGAPCWFELSTTDQDAAGRFYSAVFDWSVQNYPMGTDGVYTMFQSGGYDVAAACAVQRPGMRPVWMTYFNTPEIDATVEKAVELGGSVLSGPFDVATHGRMAVLRDPEGATFALWKAGTHIGAQRVGESDTIGWSELLSRDIAAAARFYSGVLGVSTKYSASAPGAYIEFGVGSQHFGGFRQKDSETEVFPSHWGFYILVDDCDATVQIAQDNGGQALYGPYDVPTAGRTAVLADPQGAVFSVITLKTAA